MRHCVTVSRDSMWIPSWEYKISIDFDAEDSYTPSNKCHITKLIMKDISQRVSDTECTSIYLLSILGK